VRRGPFSSKVLRRPLDFLPRPRVDGPAQLSFRPSLAHPRTPPLPVADTRGPRVSIYLPPLPRLRLGVERASGRRTIRSLGPRASASSATNLGAPPSRATPHPYP
jgi:hypothetical protein